MFYKCSRSLDKNNNKLDIISKEILNLLSKESFIVESNFVDFIGSDYKNTVLLLRKKMSKTIYFDLNIDIEEILFKFEQELYWNESGKFARTFQDRIKSHIPMKSRGVHSANFYVLRRAKMPSILLETGFISNSNDEALLKQPAFRDKIVDAISRGLL